VIAPVTALVIVSTGLLQEQWSEQSHAFVLMLESWLRIGVALTHQPHLHACLNKRSFARGLKCKSNNYPQLFSNSFVDVGYLTYLRLWAIDLWCSKCGHVIWIVVVNIIDRTRSRWVRACNSTIFRSQRFHRQIYFWIEFSLEWDSVPWPITRN